MEENPSELNKNKTILINKATVINQTRGSANQGSRVAIQNNEQNQVVILHGTELGLLLVNFMHS